MQYALPRIKPRKWRTKLWDFQIQKDHVISARWADFLIVNENKKKRQLVHISFPPVHGVKLKERKKRDKYLDLEREL